MCFILMAPSLLADVIDGSSSNDTLQGTEGDDLITGYGGDDRLYGNAGDDTFLLVVDETGFDRFYGGDGFDQIIATAADDVIGIVRFRIDDGSTVELIDGGEGYNIISVGDGGSHHLDFSATQLTNIAEIHGGSAGGMIRDSDEGHIILGGLSNDSLYGNGGDDTLSGGGGDDRLYGDAGDDTFLLVIDETGFDRFYGGDGFDQIIATAADDVIGIVRFRIDDGSTVELIDGGEGYNIISAVGDGGSHHLDFSATQLTNIAEIHGGSAGGMIRDSDEGHIILGGLSNDSLYGNGGDDTLRGGGGDDRLYGDAGDDTFLLVIDETGFDRFYGGDGFDQIIATAADDVIGIVRFRIDDGSTVELIDGGEGYNIISAVGDGGSHHLDFSATQLTNIAEIHGGSAGGMIRDSDEGHIILGGLSNDSLYGNGGDDTLSGGSGDDRLYGDAGDDTFLLVIDEIGFDRFYGGDGFDQIIATTADDVIGIVRFRIDDGSTVELIDGGEGYNIISAVGDGGSHHLDFSATQLVNIAEIHGGSAGGLIQDSDEGHIILGGLSNDSLYGNGGDDTLTGGSGDDRLYGDAGDDTFLLVIDETGFDRFYGGDGFDQIIATAADDVIGIGRYRIDDGSTVELIDGGEGYNIISAEGGSGGKHLDFSATQLIDIAEIHGGPANDTIRDSDEGHILVGGLGLDYLYGNGGDDTYQFSAGDGTDFIHNEVTGVSDASFDRLITTNIASELLWFNKSGNDLKISIIGSGDQITVDDWYLGSTYQLDEIEAGNGRVLASAQVDQLVSAMAAHPIPESVNAVIPSSVLEASAQAWSDENSANNTPPIVSIATPSANAEYTSGDSISFTAAASDSEDGDISAGINWSSDLDGSLGSGAGVNVSTLSVGTHIITVAVVDSASAAANDSIVVTVAASVGDASVVYVSDMPWVTETNGWGFAERDRSNGELAADDGNPITLDGVVYAKGIGAHANSEITVELNGDYEQFTSMVGLDDEMDPNGSVVFEVYGDDQLLFQSSVHVGSTAAEAVDVSVAGVNTLRLVITNAGDGSGQDRADWADAKLHLPSGYSAPDTIIVAPANNSVTSSGETVILTGSANDTQDGDVSSSLQWTSNLDGLLGAGTSLSVGTLSIGLHTITATATDSDGTVGNAVIVLTVAATPVTPKALISASGSAIVFNETVSSPSGRLGISNIAYEQLWLSRSGNDLKIDVVGSDEQIIINGWYLGSAYQFDGIEASDGRVLARDQVDQLVNAMAVFAIPEGVGAVIPQSTLDNLLQVWPSVWVSSP